jgi:ABC-type polysaccharide/polyol phosphate transport system ATPase subunit
MRTYSKGMYGRLAFAVATHIDPDILLIDEALSAGDAAFKEKCQHRIRELCSEDRTIVLVSHGLALVRELSDSCIWLDKGALRGEGDPTEVVAAYRRSLDVGETAAVMEDV